ncbi:hypothetical protein O3P69_003227 [Scylla paramamosain]|uniref:Uncharacterized protein n=1 Tax=Scylla paramamosain TaxID=85552 RepID=A0AAW0UL34_SCYPA
MGIAAKRRGEKQQSRLWWPLFLHYNDTVRLVPPELKESNLTVAQVAEQEYFCCVITEGPWTAFFCVLSSVLFLSLAVLKYLRKDATNPKTIRKNWKRISKVMYGECSPYNVV